MGNTPSPNPIHRALSRASIIGAVLGIAAIILFGILWVVLGGTDLSPIARMLLSLCIPPALLTALMGLYLLVIRPRASTPPDDPER